FINRYFHPDHSATSQLLSDLAFGLADRGWDVEVLTSRQTYGDPRAPLAEEEKVAGVQIRRLGTTRFGRQHLGGRLLDYLSFHARVYWQLRRDEREVVVAMTDPPLIGTTAALALHGAQSRLVLWSQDLFPEVAFVDLLKGSLGIRRILEWLRDLALERSAEVVVLGERMRERVMEIALRRAGSGAPHRRIPPLRIIENWALDESVASGVDERERFGLADEHFVVGYSGNFGRVHEFRTILDAAIALEDEPRIRFLMTGGGPRYPFVRSFVREHGLENVILGPYQPRETLGAILATADVHLISLGPGYEGLVVPSKFYGIAAAGRPTLYVGLREGDVARLIERHDCGIVIKPGDSRQLTATILDLSCRAERARKMGANARDAWQRNWTKEVAIERWEAFLNRMSVHRSI
ncbi:MAG: glycosyltransferase family 4 protein, partial [Thermoanaerobaculia bacterium]|nr:glycosyltransferase family 4 protein [Thermoanaerobaculia bacterium]